MKQYSTHVSVRQMKEQHSEAKHLVKRRMKEIRNSKLLILLYNGFDLHMKSPTFEQMVKEGVLFMSMSFKILL